MSKSLLSAITAILILPAAATFASTERVIYSFTGGPDGGSPQAPLLADSAGNLYGTASTGGAKNSNCVAQGCGVVFMLTPPKTRTGTWTETVLYQFQGGNDLDIPMAGLTFDKAGNLYGTAVEGGTLYGGAFELSRPKLPGGSWTETVLYRFANVDDDGAYPLGSLLFDAAGNLYGTTVYGGGGDNAGTVFQLQPPPQPGELWTENLLRVFGSGAPGAFPQGTLLIDKVGNLYGTTMDLTDFYDEKAAFFKLKREQGGRWICTVLHTFDGETEGYEPADLTLLAGRLYGTAAAGGANNAGTVFSLKPPAPGGQWTAEAIYTFAGGADGGTPTRSLVADRSGNLYGATTKAGTKDYGTVFKLSPQPGGTWTETTLHEFGGGNDGAQPASGLIFGKFGALYGVTASGGSSGNGTVYAVLP